MLLLRGYDIAIMKRTKPENWISYHSVRGNDMSNPKPCLTPRSSSDEGFGQGTAAIDFAEWLEVLLDV